MEHQGAILIQKNKETIKWFKYWNNVDTKKGRIEITWKDEDGERHSLVKEYKATQTKITVSMMVEAVIKYWPKFNPQVHDIVTSSGHNHSVTKVKKKT